MTKQYIGITGSTIKGDKKYYRYAQVWSNGSVRIVEDIVDATKFKSEQEAIDSLFRVSMWVCEYVGDEIIKLGPTR